MYTHPQHPRDDFNGTSSHSCVLNIRFWDSCVPKYVICVEPDLKLTVTWSLLIWWICRTADRHTPTHRQMLWNSKFVFFFFFLGKAKKSLCLFAVCTWFIIVIIIITPTITHAFEMQRFISMDFWQVLPLKLICVFSLITLCWCNIHHWWGVDKIVIGAVKCCLVDLVTICLLFHHHCSSKVCIHTTISQQKTCTNYMKKLKNWDQLQYIVLNTWNVSMNYLKIEITRRCSTDTRLVTLWTQMIAVWLFTCIYDRNNYLPYPPVVFFRPSSHILDKQSEQSSPGTFPSETSSGFPRPNPSCS